jgi:predicted helicase
VTTKPLEIFYSYAPEDEQLLDKLNQHLALMKRDGIITEWYDRKITPGSLKPQEVSKHLQSAHIILLLVSPAFIASDYCDSIEVTQALKREEAGEARVIPVILRPCDWESAPFGKLQALPKKAKPVTIWPNRDSAFTDIAKGIRKAIGDLNGKMQEALPKSEDTVKKQVKDEKKIGGRKKMTDITTAPEMPTIPTTPMTLGSSALKPAISRYYKSLKELEGRADYELALRGAFQNLLADAARMVNWVLIPEQTLEGNIRPDGVLRDSFDLKRGFWEAKGPKSDLEREIQKKIANGYPLINTIFENTKRAILYQNKNRANEYDLLNPNDVVFLLRDFFTYTEPEIESFWVAVNEFKEQIPELARALLSIIEQEHKLNKKFIAAFNDFAELCRASLNPKITNTEINEMLIQHMLTERLFATIFDNSDFVSRNVIATEIEQVIQALTSRSFNRKEFLRSLDRFYIAIEQAAKGIESWSEQQHFLNVVYERFFQGFSVKQADTHGIVYTPQEIVDFMCASVDEALRKEFGTSIAQPGIKLLDPATGTGNFIVNLIRNYIPRHHLKEKYLNDLFCNEITLLPYYIASLNIEHEYYEKMGSYEPFEGICFADTLELAEGQQLSLFVEENTERVKREKSANIMVVIGNPPYNVGQKSENDNNKNRKYPIIDKRIRDTYAKESKASNKNALSDAYVKFFRWATDRLGEQDGIVCLITNNSFIDQIAFDGMRKHLQKDFTEVYHIDLHGNARQDPQHSGTTHNVFGIQVGVGITIAIRNSLATKRNIYYYSVPKNWRKMEKLKFLEEMESIINIKWSELIPDKRNTWITEGLSSDFDRFLPIGLKEAKAQKVEAHTVFKSYGRGIATSRDIWAYGFDKNLLKDKIVSFIQTYNGEIDRWRRRGSSSVTVDDFVLYDDTRIKWSRDLKLDLQRNHYANFDDTKIRCSIYRPFCKKFLFFDRILNEEVYQFLSIFPTKDSELENIVIVVTDIGSEKPFMVLASDIIPDLHLVGAGSSTQCFPFYTYSEDGTKHHENITDWSLQQFQKKYGSDVIKWDVFYYVYSMLHHPQYRKVYVENLKRDLPHIPLIQNLDTFRTCVHIGKQLMDLHINYEQVREYPLVEWLETKGIPFSWRVEKMRLSTDKRVVVVNESLRLGPIPSECFEYRLGNRSALEWVIDQYQVSKDSRSGIESDPNNLDDEEYIVRLVCKIVTVSVETVKLVKELEQTVKPKDWLGELAGQSEEGEQSDG